jgi:hypothetical protein
MAKLQTLSVILALLTFSSCTTAELSGEGTKVVIAQPDEVKACKNMGQVIGQGGGTFGGAFISNDSLMKYALNDMRNKAGEMGATHVVSGSPQLGGGSGTTSTATVMGTAYKCAN